MSPSPTKPTFLPALKFFAILLLALSMLVTVAPQSSSASPQLQYENISEVISAKRSYTVPPVKIVQVAQQQTDVTVTVPTPPNKLHNQSYWQQIRLWLYQKQAGINKQLSENLQKFNETNDYKFAGILILASFLYGLVHAAGPGHGKVVVSSYIVANQQTMRRGILLAFLSAFVQGTTAVVLVGSLVFLFDATGRSIKQFGLHLTQMSYVLIITLGIYLLISTIKRHYKTFLPVMPGDPTTNHHHHDEDCGCDHKHMPDASELAGKWDIAKITSLVLSVGLRPCSGALYILAFALVKGLFWVGAISVYAMALGTAITISLVTMAVVSGRNIAFITTKENSRTRKVMSALLSMSGAVVIILFGAILLSSTFVPARPF